MASLDLDELQRCWNGLYAAGRYAAEPPLPFTGRIIEMLGVEGRARGPGLYVGCGNGRNFRALLAAGLDVYGLDASQVALDHLVEVMPAARDRVVCGDFRDARVLRDVPAPLGYVVAIQVFQHGDESDVAGYFARVADLLPSGGLFFLRVNSTASEIFFSRRGVDENEHGGFSVECLDGPKLGQAVHFYTDAELLARTAAAFRVVVAPTEVRECRVPPRQGTWAQWEAVFARR